MIPYVSHSNHVNQQYSFHFFAEPFLESMPQVYVLICLSVSNDIDLLPSFIFTLAISLLSGGFGITKFLMKGPCKIIPSESGLLDGLVSLGFPTCFLTILSTLFGKGILLPIVAWELRPWHLGRLNFAKTGMWIGFNLLPQFIYVSCYFQESKT